MRHTVASNITTISLFLIHYNYRKYLFKLPITFERIKPSNPDYISPHEQSRIYLKFQTPCDRYRN